MNLDLVKAITELLRVLAWPVVAFIAIWWFRPELRVLIARFRRGAGLEFDPSAGQDTKTVATTPTALTALPGDIGPLPPSAATFVGQIRAAPLFQGSTDAQRVERLLHAVGFLTFAADAERIEGQIWTSQVSLLEYLNAVDAGDALPNLKARFYDPAAARFSPMFANYPFESYLAFLKTNELISVDGGVAKITQKGRDYLAWRIQYKKPPRLAG